MLVKDFKEIIKQHIVELLEKRNLQIFFSPSIDENIFTIRLKEQYWQEYKARNAQRNFKFRLQADLMPNLRQWNSEKELKEILEKYSLVNTEQEYIENYKKQITEAFDTEINKSNFIGLEKLLNDAAVVAIPSTRYLGEPVYLKTVRIKNYQGIKETQIKKDIPNNARWIFLTGENGFGKTSLLRAIALILQGFESHSFEKDIKPDITAEVYIGTGEASKRLSLSPTIEKSPNLPNIIAYGASRLDMEAKENSKETESPTRNLFETRTFLKNIELQLPRWYLLKEQGDAEYTQKYDNLIRIFKKILTNVGDILIDPKKNEVKYQELDHEKLFLRESTFNELASGYKSMIAIIGDIILRLFAQQPNIYDPKELSGIVIIDEFDLHLHPKIQRHLPSLLFECFPHIQFIVSTHSPIPLLGAPKNSVFLKVVRTQKEGIRVENLDNIAISNLTPNTILTSPIFDFEEISSQINASIGDLRSEDDYQEVVFDKILDKKLREIAQKGNDRFNQVFNPMSK